LPSSLSAHPTLSIPALGAFQLHLTPFNSTPTFKARGRCCGSGCRHCPYAHECVPEDRRAATIQVPAPLHVSSSGNAKRVVALLWSGGKDSFLALRAMLRCVLYTGPHTTASAW
jgi:hypothetical protein